MYRCLRVGTIAVFTCCSLIGLAQDGSKPATPKATPAGKVEAKADAAKKGRLPANFGKLGLTEAQKVKIYGVQAQYDGQLEVLEKQIAAIKLQRDQEVEGVLSEDQRKILKNLVAAAKEARAKKTPSADVAPAPEEKK